MGKLVRLELFNFKSYKGHHVLLFGDAYFTSIIGPNGSGKSNSMDAISFVLGIKSSHLRSTHLRELVYRGRVLRKSTTNGDTHTNGTNGHVEDEGSQVSGTQERNDPKSAWVMAVYEDDAGDEQKWKRTITNQGVSEYRLNEHVVTAQQYNESLEEENILIKARNFLVFQGDVEAIAIQKPQDLTKLIEQVSGSLEYKAEYDELKAKLDEAAEQQAFQLNRRRGINSEIRQYQEQKREADNFQKKAAERDDAIVTHVLWKLYHLQRQIEESSAEIQKHQNDLKEFRRGIEKYERNLETAKKDHAQAARGVGKAEKAIKAKEREIDDKTSSLVPIDEQIAVSNNQLTKYANRVNAIQKERSTQSSTVAQLEKDLATVEKAQAQWQKQWEQNASRLGGQLSEADLQQYTRLREDLNKRASADLSRVERLKSERAPIEATYNNLKNSVESTEYKLKSLENEYDNVNERRDDVKEVVQATQAEIDTKKKELHAATSRRLQAARTRTELDEKLADVARKLLEADDGRRTSEREMRMKETIAMLKRTYPGVKGRVHELCKPKQKKYQEAVSTVLGRHFDAVVVDTEATAKQCIEYLRDHRSGQATFIPLDTIQVKALNSNLKGMHRGMRPAIETVDYDQAVSRAISYACGNSIVCDDLAIAKELVYNRGVEAKAVTLDGSVIHKGGLMTGGRGREQNTRRWDDAEVTRLTTLKDKLMEEFAALPQERSRVAEEQTLQTELSGLESRLRFAKEELDALSKNLQSKKREIDHVKQQLSEERPKMQAEHRKLEKIDDDISDYQESVNNVENEVFADFCQQHGFDDIRDYEARQGSLQQEAAQKKLEFVTQKGRIEGQLSFERSRLQATDDRLEALRDREQRDKETIDELNEQRQGIQDDLDTLKNELDELHAQLDEQKELLSNAAEALAKQKHEVQKRSKEMESTFRAISALEGEMQRHSSTRYSLLRRCKIENIAIPLAEGSATLESVPINDLPLEDADAMDVDEDDPTSSALKTHTVTDYGIDPDFDALDDELKDEDNEAMESKLLEDIAKLSAALDKMQPNAHAAQRLATVEARARNTEQEYEVSRTEYRKIKANFEETMEKRNELFNKAFSHISEQIEPIYSNLTKSDEFPAGGRAYLTADEEEPYLAGVNYHTMPPTKRFRDMEHLSGGEKTMAALALLFAIHSYQPSPFFVLDEVDAALDNANVGKLVNYVRNHAGPGMQFIVISLKTGFFQGSEALVGVYRDQGANSSKVLTLDLRKYS
ncbi:Structural maintenance of chromosomes protein 1 [Exophiala xenobiotica]|uniref:Structural maintenance of chromosomes protein n=1 Tax=Vermiconidia calcicola TaxID=1690605 RepID=A0AAV9QMT3_9PEZI|nr:Structural maintenance of chromosomes protein 1 [Exophiala xenobiotica]KAK5543983.1 Structural maintenance of chromosomes protein 1 [Vermiconidia calcicola]KAK5547738.1 Structural maintenance of chromosomes protein 1 [Chaetothyriales sp. CCFEE 6169]KAK5271370.1 Structural maintenance of chromosomes protein 1 [Exophiala xenobiotica]KAK5289504.1 Structural maintenance of chromosomes protein 1 [Exophiala xenobiotica]